MPFPTRSIPSAPPRTEGHRHRSRAASVERGALCRGEQGTERAQELWGGCRGTSPNASGGLNPLGPLSPLFSSVSSRGCWRSPRRRLPPLGVPPCHPAGPGPPGEGGAAWLRSPVFPQRVSFFFTFLFFFFMLSERGARRRVRRARAGELGCCGCCRALSSRAAASRPAPGWGNRGGSPCALPNPTPLHPL